MLNAAENLKKPSIDQIIESHMDSIKECFDADAKITIFVRHGNAGDPRDILFGEDEPVTKLIASNFNLKKQP